MPQSRQLLQQTTDPSTAESLRTYIEELELRLLIEMGEGPSKLIADATQLNIVSYPWATL